MSSSPWLAAGAAFAAVALAPWEARAQARPLRIDYEAHEGFPGGAAFLEQVLARTNRARAAVLDEPALDVWVRITRGPPRGDGTAGSAGRLVLWKSSGARAREVDSDECRDVVTALALITALAIDPNAASPRQSVASDPPAPSGIVPGLAPSIPVPPVPTSPRIPTSLRPTPPLQATFLPPPPPRPERTSRSGRWVLGGHASVAFAVTPRPLIGGGLFVERAWAYGSGPWGGSVRLVLELATTGSFDIGPGGVNFLRGGGRFDGCPFARPARWLALGVCLGADAGFLRGEGLRRGSIATAEAATVPWVALGVLPRVAVEAGRFALFAVEGGPTFPLVRRSFVFERPDYTIHEVPAVTGELRVGAGIRF